MSSYVLYANDERLNATDVLDTYIDGYVYKQTLTLFRI